ncbi:MAG: 6-carboxytetrahydropterin synthase QueD [Chitinophagaceae bacterium]|nr:MAG: 6-carboxytetrahydropterin synthase QueD [Chitinophagaceae bacterium]
MIVFKQFSFDSAHFLPNVPEGHKCREVHGHTYRMIVHLKGGLDEHLGWVMDFSEMKKVISPIVDSIDHKLLNNVSGLENPTCEMIAIWLWNKIKPAIPSLVKIELHETPTSGAVYEGK